MTYWHISIFEVLGLSGAMLQLLAYFLVSRKKVKVGFTYQMANVIGSVCLFSAAVAAHSISNSFMEVTWGTIALIGILKPSKDAIIHLPVPE